jgi:hypothetical protein
MYESWKFQNVELIHKSAGQPESEDCFRGCIWRGHLPRSSDVDLDGAGGHSDYLLCRLVRFSHFNPTYQAGFVALIILTRIREVQSSNLCPTPMILTEVLRGLAQSIQANPGIIPPNFYNRFLRNPFQFIYLLSTGHSLV